MQLERFTGLQLGEMVNRRKVSPIEVIDYFFNRIQVRNPSINAFVYLNREDAMAEAKKLEEKIMSGGWGGPLAGVPIGLKDFLPTKKGWPATHGGVKSLQTIDDADSAFYEAAKRLGCIAIGKTNAPSFGFRGTTDNKMYGPTSTPFKPGYNSGGSSGGSGSAVGDGLVPLSEGGDAGGSIRIPAAWCGCFGFKPSAGVVPSICRPDAWTATHPYCCGGPITRSVEDAAFVLEEMQGFNPRDPLSVPLRKKAFARESQLGLAGLKIACTLDFDFFPFPEEDIVAAIEELVSMLEAEGISIGWPKFNLDSSERDRIEEAWLRGISIDSSIDFQIWKDREQDAYDLDRHTKDYPKEFLRWNDIAISSNMMDYREFHDVRTKILDAHLDVFDQYDIILAPVTGCSPVKNAKNNNTLGPKHIRDEAINPLIGFGYTYLENMIGTPAASIPIGVTSDGLPIGLQVIGRRYEDEKVFRVCGALEKMHPWSYDIPFNRSIVAEN